MKQGFRDALIRHLQQTGIGLTELARGAGVSLDSLKKLNTGKNVSTNAAQAVAIAAFFGKSLEDFVDPTLAAYAERLEKMLSLLTTEERTLVLAQIRGILHARGL